MLAPHDVIKLVEILGAPGGVVERQVHFAATLAEYELERPEKVRNLPSPRLLPSREITVH